MRTTISAATFAFLLATLARPSLAMPMVIPFTVDGGPVGPYAGVIANGVFSFDDGIIPVGGGQLSNYATGLGVLQSLSFTWDGHSFNETDSDLFLLDFAPDGRLRNWGLGAKASGVAGISVNLGPDFYIDTTAFRQTFVYLYSPPHFPTGIAFGSVTSVPEPSTWALFGVMLLWVAVVRRSLPREEAALCPR